MVGYKYLIYLLIIFIKFKTYFTIIKNQNYLKFPFDTKLKTIPKTKLNYNYNETNFINDFLNNNISINISMGIPRQNVKVLLDLNDICFSFNRNKELIFFNSQNYDNNNYNKIIPYNKINSTSAKIYSVNYPNFKNQFNKFYEIEEIFYLYKNTDKNDIFNSTIYLRFLYGNYKNEEEIIYGKIGLNMNNYKDNTCPRFIHSLKNTNILKKYIWFFDFFSSSHGIFYIGSEPHLYNLTNNTCKGYQYVKMNTIITKEGYLNWELSFNKIIIKNETNNYIFNLNNKIVQIDFNLGLIIGTYEYQKIIEENFFNFLIKNNKCKKTFVEYSFNNIRRNKYYVYNCNPSFSHYFSISYYDIFPEIEFFHIDMEHSLKLSRYDLFERINGYYYFLIIFEVDKKNNIWKLGQPFLRKYQLLFDYDSKTIGYYDKKIKYKTKNITIDSINSNKDKDIYNNTNNNSGEIIKINNNFKNVIKYFFGIIIFFMIVMMSFFMGMKIKESRKKRANELKDDDFEYLTYSNNINENTKYKQKIELNKIGI